METETNNTKQDERFQSEMEYREKAHWKVGDNIITIVGGTEKKPIAYIKLERYDDKKPVFSCVDLDGNPLTEETSNLYELKKDLKTKEAALTHAMLDKEQPAKNPERQEIHAPAQTRQDNTEVAPEIAKKNELKKSRTRTPKTKENTQSVSR